MQANANVSPNPNGISLEHDTHDRTEDAYNDFVDVDWQYWRAVNPDLIAWVNVPGTAINYPILRGEKDDPSFYLHHDIYRNYSVFGVPYFDTSDDSSGSVLNAIIYGHHMNSGKMFAALEGYRERKFFKEHPFIFFNTLQGEEKYQVFAVFSTPVYTGSDFAYYTFTKAENRKSYETFIEAVKERSFYDTGITADYGEKLLTLSTCEYSQENGRLVVVAKKIAEKEITK